MRRARTDSNQQSIINALRGVGCVVESLHRTGGGVPDLLVSRAGVNYLLEAKTQAGKLNKLQTAWHQTWRGQVAVVRTIDEALRVVGAIR